MELGVYCHMGHPCFLAGMGGSELMYKVNDRNAGMCKEIHSKLSVFKDSCLCRVAMRLYLK